MPDESTETCGPALPHKRCFVSSQSKTRFFGEPAGSKLRNPRTGLWIVLLKKLERRHLSVGIVIAKLRWLAFGKACLLLAPATPPTAPGGFEL